MERKNVAYSYSSLPITIGARVSELRNLYRIHVRNADAMFADFLASAAEIESLVAQRMGIRIKGLKVLDVGCGQQLKLARYFAHCQNHVTAIDYNAIPHGFDLPGYWALARTNGTMRVLKTFGRKVLLADARFSRKLFRVSGHAKPTPVVVKQMNAESMNFESESFDFIYSRSVFEHLEHPDRVVKEVVRVLKPGGVAHIGLHLYTCDSGAHDPRVLSGTRSEVPLWAHLRPACVNIVQPNSYLNCLRLAEWQNLFGQLLPGAYIHLFQRGREVFRPELDEMRKREELREYSDDELLTDEVVAVWRKPM